MLVCVCVSWRGVSWREWLARVEGKVQCLGGRHNV